MNVTKLPAHSDRQPQQPPGKLLRLCQILAPDGPIPVSKSTWWAKVKAKEYPPGIRLGPRMTAWRESDIVALIQRFEGDDNDRI